MTPFFVCLVFYAAIAALCLWKPNAGRIFVGLFFLAMAIGVNVTLTMKDLALYEALGANSYLPFYRTVFTEWLPKAPLLFVVPPILWELSLGLLLLSKGRNVKIGAWMGMAFLVAILPLEVGTLANPMFMVVMGIILRHNFDQSLLEMLFRRRSVARDA